MPSPKFDESVRLCVRLGVDAKKSDQIVRGAYSLPHGIGKAVRVAVFADGEHAEAAKAAGADFVGAQDLADRIQNEGWMDFDVAIAHPSMMRVVGKLGKVLGPQGKMPTPKAGTVVEAVGQAVREFKAGKIEFRNDAGGNVQVSLGRRSCEPKPLEERLNNFREVDLTLTESEAQAEAERCLRCGICSECLECLVACERGAINHDMKDELLELKVGTIILATGFKDFNPERVPELGYGKLADVLSAMEFERLINASGPTNGKVLCADGRVPQSVAIVHCVGSRDERFHSYCSRACCMYSLKLAQLVREYVGGEVHEVYRDMRTFGKGYEEFYNRTKEKGVHFYHGRVQALADAARQAGLDF